MMGLEPGLPLGLQRITHPCLMAPIQNNRIPSGRIFDLPLAFGMYTRRTGDGTCEPIVACTCTATSARAWLVSATSPSIPAVLRPALRCVTWRTLTRT